MADFSRSLADESKALERVHRVLRLERSEAERLGDIARRYNAHAVRGELHLPAVGDTVSGYRVEQGTRYGPLDRHLVRDEQTRPALTERQARDLLDTVMRIEALHNPRGYGALAPLRYLWARQEGQSPESAYALPPLRRRPAKKSASLKVHVREHLKRPPRSCLCHQSKTVDSVRRSLARRL